MCQEPKWSFRKTGTNFLIYGFKNACWIIGHPRVDEGGSRIGIMLNSRTPIDAL